VSIPKEVQAVLLKGDAMQEQEVAEAADWFRESDPRELEVFFATVNDCKPDEVRALADDRIQALCSLALIGLHVVMMRAVELEAGE
jgi:hypothetical protein